MKYAVVRHWKDNPQNIDVVEYFATLAEARTFISNQKAETGWFEWHIMKYI